MDWNFDQKLARGSFKQGFTKDTKEQEVAVPLIKELPVRLTREINRILFQVSLWWFRSPMEFIPFTCQILPTTRLHGP